MNHDVWVFIGGSVVAVVTTIGSVLVAHLQTRNRVRDLDEKVTQVHALAEPTGNGFAQEVLQSLRRVEDRLAGLEERHIRTNAWLTRHLADHAQADIHHHRHDDDQEVDP